MIRRIGVHLGQILPKKIRSWLHPLNAEAHAIQEGFIAAGDGLTTLTESDQEIIQVFRVTQQSRVDLLTERREHALDRLPCGCGLNARLLTNALRRGSIEEQPKDGA